MSAEQLDLNAIRAKLQDASGPQVLAQPGSRRRDAGIQGVPASRVSGQRVRVERSRRPPRLPQADERVAGAGRRHGMHGAARRTDRPLRAAARRDRARQAALLRHRHVARRRGDGSAGREPRGPSHQDRRQSRSPRQPRRHRSLRPGVGAHAVRPGPVEHHHRARRDSRLERLCRRDARRAVGAGGKQGRRPAHPHRDGQLAHARGADPADPRRVPGGQVDAVGTDAARQRARRRPPGVRASTWSRSTTSPRPTSCCRSTPISWPRKTPSA